MKFSKTLQEELIPEWKTKYIDYKGLKKIMHSVVDDLIEAGENLEVPENGSVEVYLDTVDCGK